MNQTATIKVLVENIRKAQKGNTGRIPIIADDTCEGKHEFLFFIKPEITLASESINLDKTLHLIFDKIAEFQLKVKNAILLPASYLEKHNIIAQHYGVINAIARDAKNTLTSSAKVKFEDLFKKTFAATPVYGGLEFLKAFPTFTPTSLDYLWQNSPTHKLGGGAYAQELKFDGETTYLVNGFHPRQLEHFILPGRSIITFTLVGDLDWSEARNSFIGKTNPADAQPGSIRNSLLERKDELGLQAVSSSWNGVHLSAGPVEGLVELVRYNSNFDKGSKVDIDQYAFGRLLSKNYNQDTIGKILRNISVELNGNLESIFDITEEKNADEAMNLLSKLKI